MNNTVAVNRFSFMLLAAILLASGAFWWVAEVRAEARAAAATQPALPPSVQDSAPAIDLDTKIFLHRNARIVTSLAPQPLA